MSLGWDVAAFLPGFRAQAESRFTETVTVGEYVDTTNPATGNPVRTLSGSASYVGPARVKYPATSSVAGDGAQVAQPVAEQQIILSLPSGTVVDVGDEVDVTGSTADASLVGARFRVIGSAHKGQTTAARYPVVELS